MTPARKSALDGLLRHKSSWATGLAGSAPAVLLASMPRRKSPMMVIGDSLDDAGYLYQDLCRLIGDDAVMFFPSGYKRDIKYGQEDAPNQILRTETLNHWSNQDAKLQFVVTYPEALAEQVASRESLQEHSLTLRLQQKVDMSKTQEWLRNNGFTEQQYVYEPGHFAARGSILDIYGYSSELPVRIDFFDDEIDSMRTFNIETQLSEKKLDSFTITSNVDSKGSKGVSLLEFIPKDTLIAARDLKFVEQRIAAIAEETFSSSAMIADEGDKHALEKVVDPEQFCKDISAFKILNFTAGAGPNENNEKDLAKMDFDCSPQGLYHKNFDLISEDFKKLLGEGYRLYILSDSINQFARLKAIFEDRKDDIAFTPVLGTLHEGFVDHATKICVFTDHQIFDRFHKYTLKSDRARSGKLAMSLKELNSIEVGDYIVHIDHGIGKFGGLLRTNVSGRTQEMVKLIYQNDDMVFVPIHALHKLSKYRGKEGVPPKISKLGSGAWNKMKERTKDKLKDIARDLIKLYAARKEEKGFQFSPDTYLQQELEASFIYEDTPDQLTATQAVKADMESPKPMDRLVCGDVGFGKTEVAIRAAFKAAVDGKQTAVLVPTTVLAYQHFRTFTDRLKDFPVRVDYLSRARTSKQVKEILADLEAGKIDIIIGTHKLIGKSVKFKDLGLLVIDEEQKFGVSVKEKLRQMKTSVDTLTMSATPIPRTLQFSLMGARDLSAINTPPLNRYPILTSVNALSDDIVSEAINFELSRNGQVFFINNRIEGLYTLENMIKRLVPDAKVAVAHGQMPPDKLEQIIVDFAAHEYDVLLSTTIVESGVDMPNVNTILVNNAQNFGLSELHQLRGRVGRSNRKAFCYLLVPPGSPLTPVARRRLQAIESFSDLGAGIHIAMQDLDIRGAGNLLGAEQSGFIADLGYEAYQRILHEAMIELRTEEFAGVLAADDGKQTQESGQDFVADTLIETDMELMFPWDYVPTESERINLYRELDNIDNENQMKEFRERLIDRFGKNIPKQAEELMLVPKLRRLGTKLGIERILLKDGLMYTYFVGEENKAYYQSKMFGKLTKYLGDHPDRVGIRERNGKRSFIIRGQAVTHIDLNDKKTITYLPIDSVAKAIDILEDVLKVESD